MCTCAACVAWRGGRVAQAPTHRHACAHTHRHARAHTGTHARTHTGTHLVDEQHAGHNLRLALLPPLANLGVNLLPHLGADLPRVPGKQRQEALLPARAGWEGRGWKGGARMRACVCRVEGVLGRGVAGGQHANAHPAPTPTRARHPPRASLQPPPAVDDINLVQGDHMHHLPPPLQLPLRALHKLGGWAWWCVRVGEGGGSVRSSL